MEPEYFIIGGFILLIAGMFWRGVDPDLITFTIVAGGAVGLFLLLPFLSLTKTKLVESRPAVIVSEFDSPNGHHFFYIDDSGSYKEQAFTDFKDVARIKNGAKLKVNYYFGKVYWGPDKKEIKAELE